MSEKEIIENQVDAQSEEVEVENDAMESTTKLAEAEAPTKDAEEKYISDTVAAQYLVDTYEHFKHLNYNSVRRYFKDYRDGRIK